jgi:uncharacterized RDD family membrane protein YckC
MTRTLRPAHLRVIDGDELQFYPKASLFLRFIARLIDVSVAWGIFVLGERVGAVLALLFLLFADGMFQGQSAGKRICGIKVVHVPTRTQARSRDSVLRNAPFGFVVILSMMPPPIGFFAFCAGAVVILGVEGLRVWRDPLGLRLGDVWAQTQVVDGKVMAGEKRVTGPTPATSASHRMMMAAPLRRRLQRRSTRCVSR